jgi:hypothetical protein
MNKRLIAIALMYLIKDPIEDEENYYRDKFDDSMFPEGKRFSFGRNLTYEDSLTQYWKMSTDDLRWMRNRFDTEYYAGGYGFHSAAEHSCLITAVLEYRKYGGLPTWTA